MKILFKRKKINIDNIEVVGVGDGSKFRPDLLLRCDQSELYLTSEDLERLGERYDVLYKKVKASSSKSVEQLKLEEYTLLQKYAFEVVELSRARRREYIEAQKKIEASESILIPVTYRHRLLRKIFRRPTQNTAQDIIDDEAWLKACEYFKLRRAENAHRAEMLEAEPAPAVLEEPPAVTNAHAEATSEAAEPAPAASDGAQCTTTEELTNVEVAEALAAQEEPPAPTVTTEQAQPVVACIQSATAQPIEAAEPTEQAQPAETVKPRRRRKCPPVEVHDNNSPAILAPGQLKGQINIEEI